MLRPGERFASIVGKIGANDFDTVLALFSDMAIHDRVECPTPATPG